LGISFINTSKAQEEDSGHLKFQVKLVLVLREKKYQRLLLKM